MKVEGEDADGNSPGKNHGGLVESAARVPKGSIHISGCHIIN